ncbi:hypothetical protein PDESU_03365 [Pontiella desulfatans]|uniref:Outer membrane protein beta-barrel domain-containing protein n=1 Tax=Pontiella desulfatans TaxID=2750659 RepID=A0A6C2U5W7_PONDE|nr:hypothetical protein [Pontiella desulfatans]VGO14796.1 hypothetical protein PDESU_03365 [Pontiella desulfatans]
MKRLCSVCLIAFFSAAAIAQDQAGIEVGRFFLRPQADLTAAYDTRATRTQGGGYEKDFYSELSGGVVFGNLPARYDFSGRARYGVRHYNETSGELGQFYDLSAALGSRGNAMDWGLSGSLSKSLDYGTAYDPDAGVEPDPILTSEENTQYQLRGNVGYNQRLSDKMSLVPAYSLLYYFQEFETTEAAEWVTHEASLQLRRKHSEETVFTLGGYYTVQTREEEAGTIGSVMLGMERDPSPKTSVLAEIGVSHADYDLSGSEQGVVGNLRGTWQLTDKIGVHAYGGTDFVPGFGGDGASMVYRLGYGIGWNVLEKLGAQASALHEYRDAVEGDGADAITRFFANAGMQYAFTDRFNLGVGYRFVSDENEPDQHVVSATAGYAY